MGIWNATQRYVCIQNAIDFSHVIGSEDCLYLDAFVPLTERNGLDVIVHIHGGAFMFGYGQEYVNPKYVMDRDVVLVIPSYRLGPLGFLSTQDEVVPGNNGMKDQVLALKWVQANIASFGGNPNSVTLAGFSAGAASVQLHYLSALSKGLFHRGISTSGTAVNGWTITKRAVEKAKKLAELVGCPISNTRELVDCLKSRPARLLMRKLQYVYELPPLPLALFSPVIERHSKHPFIDKDPFFLLKAKRVLDVPWITSTCRDESEILATFSIDRFDVLNEKWIDVAPYVLNNEILLQRKDISEKLREFYLGKDGRFSLDNFKAFAKMITDTMNRVDAEFAAKMQSKATRSPVYFYYFNYDKGENKVDNIIVPGLNLSGVHHGYDMIYMFGGGIKKQLSASDTKLKTKFLDMLFQYAKYGVPSFEGVDWIPTNGDELSYLNITDADDMKLQTVPELFSVGKLWRQLLSSEEVMDEL